MTSDVTESGTEAPPPSNTPNPPLHLLPDLQGSRFSVWLSSNPTEYTPTHRFAHKSFILTEMPTSLLPYIVFQRILQKAFKPTPSLLAHLDLFLLWTLLAFTACSPLGQFIICLLGFLMCVSHDFLASANIVSSLKAGAFSYIHSFLL